MQVELAMGSSEQELTDSLGSENPGDWILPSFIFSEMPSAWEIFRFRIHFDYVLKFYFEKSTR